ERLHRLRRLGSAARPEPGPATAGHDHRVQRITASKGLIAWLGTPRIGTSYRRRAVAAPVALDAVAAFGTRCTPDDHFCDKLAVEVPAARRNPPLSVRMITG